MTVTRATEPAQQRSLFVLVGCLLVVFVIGVWAAWQFAVDDSFITYRYSANLVAGHGPVWNTTGPRVEGFTDFAWMMWDALGATLGLALPMFAKWTSLIAGLATLLMLVGAARRHGGWGAPLIAGLAYVLFLPTYFHITGGLETAVIAAVILRIVQLGLRVLDGRAVRAWELPLLLLLAGMLRPEGVLAALPAMVVWLWRERRSGRAWICTVVAAMIGAGYFVWRWQYYGQLLPNTFYVKFGHVDAGYLWTVHTAKVVLPLALLTLSLLLRKRTRPAGWLLTATVALTYLTYAVSGPTMDYLDRFADHAFPVLCLGAGLGAAALGRRIVVAGAGIVAVAWTLVLGVTTPDLGTIANYGPDLARAQIAIGKGLAESAVPPSARTVAVSDAGAIPYYSRWHAIDYIGLNDRSIAHGASPTSVVVAARPTVVLVTGDGTTVPTSRYGLDNTKATAGYVKAISVEMRQGYWPNVFVLPRYASTVRDAISRAVAAATPKDGPARRDATVDHWLETLRTRLP